MRGGFLWENHPAPSGHPSFAKEGFGNVLKPPFAKGESGVAAGGFSFRPQTPDI